MKNKQTNKETHLKYDFNKSCHFTQTGVSQICTIPTKITLALKHERLTVIFYKVKKKILWLGFSKQY